MRFLFFSLIFPILFCAGSSCVVDLISEADMIVFYNNGQIETMTESQFDKVDSLFQEAISDALEMPAFGVSLDKLTKEEMKKGFWLEFKFDETCCSSDMPFDSLLIKIEKSSFGVNLIRGNDGVYEGRCFYLDLNGNNFDKLYDFLAAITSGDEEFEVENEEIKETQIEEVEEEDKKEKETTKSGQTLLEKLN